MNAFITGSRAYGKPTVKSDVDLVIRVDSETAVLLRKLSDCALEIQEAGGPRPVRFGGLNLILCETDEEWAVWKIGTVQLSRTGSMFDKAEAKGCFDVLRGLVGIHDKADSSFTKKA